MRARAACEELWCRASPVIFGGDLLHARKDMLLSCRPGKRQSEEKS
jgi:hypothetical protein